MKISIISLGKFENSPQKLVFETYLKRLKWKVELKEIEQKNSKNLTSLQLKEFEAQQILKSLKTGSKIIALDERAYYSMLMYSRHKSALNTLFCSQ